MKQKAYRQNPMVIDISKKARPPPGEITLVYMNCLTLLNQVLHLTTAIGSAII